MFVLSIRGKEEEGAYAVTDDVEKKSSTFSLTKTMQYAMLDFWKQMIFQKCQ